MYINMYKYLGTGHLVSKHVNTCTRRTLKRVENILLLLLSLLPGYIFDRLLYKIYNRVITRKNVFIH